MVGLRASRKEMTVDRLRDVPGFSIDRVAAAAGTDPEVLRLENLDTGLGPPQGTGSRHEHPQFCLHFRIDETIF